MRGKLIVFEGGEGSGKTTQIKQLYDWLKRSEVLSRLQERNAVAGVKLTREPGGTALGQQIRRLLLAQHSSPEICLEEPIASRSELLLYAADRAQHVEATLIPWLAQGYWVLCDRYTDSTVAYQGYGRQLDLALIDQLNQMATGGLKSDLTLWLRVSPAVGLARMQRRGQADRIELASEAFHQRVSEGFAALAAESKRRGEKEKKGKKTFLSSGPMVEIEGDRPVETVAAQIQQIVQQQIAQWYLLSLN